MAEYGWVKRIKSWSKKFWQAETERKGHVDNNEETSKDSRGKIIEISPRSYILKYSLRKLGGWELRYKISEFLALPKCVRDYWQENRLDF